MLFDPIQVKLVDDPVTDIFLSVMGNTKKRLAKGIWQISCWNPEMIFGDQFKRYPDEAEMNPDSIEHYLQWKKSGTVEYYKDYTPSIDPDILRSLYKEDKMLATYGVCDSVSQLLDIYAFEKDPRALFISMVELRKDQQPSDGGWRWHKWGEYIGTQEPQCEYLYDEPVIEKVYTYNIYEFKNELVEYIKEK